MEKLLKQIKSHNWFLGVRREGSLLFYSMKARGEKKYLPKFGLSYVDRMLVTVGRNYAVRVMNEEEASSLHTIMRKRVLNNPKVLSDFVKKDYAILENLVKASVKLREGYKKNTPKKNLALFIKSYELYSLHSAYTYICFAGGVQLLKNMSETKDKVVAKKALEDHDKWRNFITFPEEEFGENIFYYLRDEFMNAGIKPISDYKYLDIIEIINYLKTRKDSGLAQKIKKRKDGIVYLALGNHFETITNKLFIEDVNAFLKQTEKSNKTSGRLGGQVAFGKGKIEGGVVKILDIKKFKGNLKEKILVAVQTTPHFIPYLRGAKAIITDEGGITCHAAIIARELKIPCIVGVKNATKILKDGDIVEMNLSIGRIRNEKEIRAS